MTWSGFGSIRQAGAILDPWQRPGGGEVLGESAESPEVMAGGCNSAHKTTDVLEIRRALPKTARGATFEKEP